MFALLSLTAGAHAQSFSINAEVDREEVGFGESLSLVLTITQSLTSGANQRISIPAVSSIPGFDIASTRSGQSTTFVNGVGQTQSQILYELVPQQSGKVTIPAFSFKDPLGNEHSTRAIEINVLPPQEEPEKPAEAPVKAATENDPPSSWFKIILIMGIILGCVVALPFVLSAFINRKTGPSPLKPSDSDSLRSSAGSGMNNDAEDAIITAAVADNAKSVFVRQQIHFSDAVARLKREFPDADSEFYHRYFVLFRDAALGRCSKLNANMTYDELFRKICELVAGDSIASAARRLAGDLEMVMYANRAPARGFASIDADAREIINAIAE